MPEQLIQRRTTRGSAMGRLSLGRTPLRWGAASTSSRKMLEDGLALFERQVEDEGRRRGERS